MRWVFFLLPNTTKTKPGSLDRRLPLALFASYPFCPVFSSASLLGPGAPLVPPSPSSCDAPRLFSVLVPCSCFPPHVVVSFWAIETILCAGLGTSNCMIFSSFCFFFQDLWAWSNLLCVSSHPLSNRPLDCSCSFNNRVDHVAFNWDGSSGISRAYFRLFG